MMMVMVMVVMVVMVVMAVMAAMAVMVVTVMVLGGSAAWSKTGEALRTQGCWRVECVFSELSWPRWLLA